MDSTRRTPDGIAGYTKPAINRAYRTPMLLAAVWAACTPDANTPLPGMSTVTDSAGVRVVDLGDAPLDIAPRLAFAPDPEHVIRSREDDASALLYDVRDVEMLPRGRIAVANGSGNEILVFDSSGEPVATWGGTGDGPGEFRSLEWLALLPPDTFAAGDRGLRRATVFNAAGQYIRSFGTADAVDRASNPIPPIPVGLLDDGSVIAVAYSQPDPVPGSERPAVEIVAIPPTADSVHAIGTWPGEEVAKFRDDGLLEVTQPPFGRRLHLAATADGVWIADDDRWEARKYSAGGELRMIVRSSAGSVWVTDELLEAFIRERYRDAAEVPTLEEMKEDLREIARQTTTPSFGMIVGRTDGGVAIGEFGLGTASPRKWVTVQPNGTVATVELPAGLDVKRWGPNWILGVVRDELDREEIHLYRILTGAAPGPVAQASPSLRPSNGLDIVGHQ